MRAAQIVGHGSSLAVLLSDDAQLARLIRTILEESGFDVIVTQSRSDAMFYLRSEASTSGAAILDLPFNAGTADISRAVQTIRSVSPRVAVLFMSGYSGDEILPASCGPDVRLLQKPFKPSDLVGTLRELIG